MLIAVPAETSANERRVALIPDSVNKLIKAGFDVSVESGLGRKSGYSDSDYSDVGASVSSNRQELVGAGDIVLRV